MRTSAGTADDTATAEPPFIQFERLRTRNQGRSTVVCQHGMVCASQPLAAMAGIDMLKAGGNCVDAAIAANAVLGVTEPASNGIGGDLFAIVWCESEQQLQGLNASGRAPYDWSLSAAQALGLQEIPRVSPLSWTVPGCVSGWAALNQRYGRLPWKQCLEAAIDYAQHGLSPIAIDLTAFRFRSERTPQPGRRLSPSGSEASLR